MTIKEQAVSDAAHDDGLLLAESYKGTDIVKALLDHKEHALKGTYPGVQSPHYSIAGMFEWAAAEIERLRAASHPLEQQQAVSGDVVKRVARAIAEAGDFDFDTMGEKRQIACLHMARAALTASGVGRMREALGRANAIIGGLEDFDGLDDDDYSIMEYRLRVGDIKMIRAALDASATDHDGEG